MKITFIRHTESEYNQKRIYQGQYDCDCSENGMEKLKEFAKTFNQQYDICYCSPLKRTRITASMLVPNIKTVYDNRIKEIKLGEWENTPITDEKQKLFSTGQYIPKGAETKAEFDARIINFLDMIKFNQSDKDRILVVTHGGVIRAINRILDPNNKLDKINNLDIYKVNLI